MLYNANLNIIVRESEGTLSYTREDLIKYSGHGHVIASGLIMRLFSRAFKDLSPASPPDRRRLRVLSAFPGLGVRDGIELVTHAVTDGRFILDMQAGPDCAPCSPIGGRMYFEVALDSKAYSYAFDPEIFDDEWRMRVANTQKGAASLREHADYVAYKYAFLGRLLTAENPFSLIKEAPESRLLDL